MKIENITKYKAYGDKLKWFGIYKGNKVDDIVALISIEIVKYDKNFYFAQINAGEKGMGKKLMDLSISWCKKNKEKFGCNRVSWIADPESNDDLKEYYRKNWPEAKEKHIKIERWKTSEFTIKI